MNNTGNEEEISQRINSLANQDQVHFEILIQGLIDQQYGCCDDFVNTQTTLGLRNILQDLYKRGEMKSAGLGQNVGFQMNKLIRGDKINWLDKSSLDEFEGIFQRKVEAFITYLNKTCYTSINDSESHYASYERNSFYKRHLDQFKEDKGRKFSIILYLNDNWQIEDGGMLSLYIDADHQVDISPIGGRMVFFRSDQIEHEVHPSFTRDRLSLTGWLKSK